MIYLLLLFLSFLGTYAMRWYSLKRSILDIPNERSSHSIAVPRGGGIAIVIVFYIGLFYFRNIVEDRLFYALLYGIPIALISILDDIFTLSVKLRFLVQSISVACALYTLGGIDEIDFIFFKLHGMWLNLIVYLAMIWIMNLYNFLDGIDGYAATEAITIGIGIFVLFQNPIGLVIVMANLGFLYFNWHKASIFMGDVGSVTLGFIFSVFVFSDTSHGNIYIWIILLSIFWFDATITLVRRLINHENITVPHKKHAYQRLVQSGESHSSVTIYAFFINIIFIGLLFVYPNVQIITMINIITLIILLHYIEIRKPFL